MFRRIYGLFGFTQQEPTKPQDGFRPHPSWLRANEENRRQRTGARCEERDIHGNTALIRSIARGNFAEMRDLLDNGADIEARGNNGYTPLAVAVFLNCMDAASYLIRRGANLEVWTNGTERYTPLTMAIRNRNEEMVHLLIASGADVNAHDSTRLTPLILAAEYGEYRMVGMLLQAGANPALCGNGEQLAEEAAAQHGRFDIVELLRTDPFTLCYMDFSLEPIVNRAPAPAPVQPLPQKWQSNEMEMLDVRRTLNFDDVEIDTLGAGRGPKRARE